MYTQQLGTDISADVSFTTVGGFVPLYQFKGDVARAVGFAAGVFDVTINRGEGIDLEHGEVNVFHGTRRGEAGAVTGLRYDVRISPASPTAAGEIVYRVSFHLPTYNPGSGEFPVPFVDCVATDPQFASITIRRKIPSVA